MANAVDATINAAGQVTYGLTWAPDTGYSISGLGLNTFGFLWLVGDIWWSCPPPVDSVWEDCECDNCG